MERSKVGDEDFPKMYASKCAYGNKFRGLPLTWDTQNGSKRFGAQIYNAVFFIGRGKYKN